ncbi:MAG: glycine--tRNA ligase, partial [Bacteroidetes bacterium]|nr:glycine--tRNA ligase [Bacteroidota bacterium]
SKNQSELNLTAKVHPNTASNTKLTAQTLEGKHYVPFVIEPSAGVERCMLAVMNEAYHEEPLPAKEGQAPDAQSETRIVLKLKPFLAPIKAAVIPLARNKPELMALATQTKATLQKLGLGRILLETSGNVGKAYRKHDEVGTPLCVTVDFQSLEDGTVTIRHRDTMQQERLSLAELPAYLQGFYRVGG